MTITDHDALLQVSDVRVRFGAVTALDGVSVAVPQGMLMGVIGANGAGKSVLFDVITGFTRPETGTVVFNGDDVTGLGASARARRSLRRTFQSAELFDDLTVWENVSVGAGAGAGNEVEQLLNELGLSQWRNRLARDIPAGLRRRVDLARALSSNPKMLLLDEPGAGLSGPEADALASTLDTMCKAKGVSVLLVEHDMALIRQVCQYVYVLNFGKIIAEGTPEELMVSQVVQEAYLGG
jgi:branched-chain amino acid transport system ATP-binding protein